MATVLKQKNKAFTLIELLFAITVVGVLAAIVAFGWTNLKQRERDSIRKSDLVQIKSALGIFYSKQSPNSYVAATSPITIDNRVFGGPQQLFLSLIPVEKVPGHAAYQYESDAMPNQYFILSCDLENDNDGDRNTAPPDSFSLTANYDYWIRD